MSIRIAGTRAGRNPASDFLLSHINKIFLRAWPEKDSHMRDVLQTYNIKINCSLFNSLSYNSMIEGKKHI